MNKAHLLKQFKSESYRTLSAVLVALLLVTCVSVSVLRYSASGKISESNPTFKFINVDGKVGQAAKYTPTGT